MKNLHRRTDLLILIKLPLPILKHYNSCPRLELYRVIMVAEIAC